jgi:O-antigen/teichoic acid export membrane protein
MAINALSGPTGILLQLSGMHWKYVQYQAVSIGMALILMPFVSDGFGIYGVCVLFLCSKLLWNLLSRKKIKETLGVEPSVLALFSSRHVSFYELKEDILEFR